VGIVTLSTSCASHADESSFNTFTASPTRTTPDPDGTALQPKQGCFSRAGSFPVRNFMSILNGTALSRTPVSGSTFGSRQRVHLDTRQIVVALLPICIVSQRSSAHGIPAPCVTMFGLNLSMTKSSSSQRSETHCLATSSLILFCTDTRLSSFAIKSG